MKELVQKRHTPGPWIVVDDVITATGDHGILCRCPNHPENQKNWDADACLISAAPDLLKALGPFALLASQYDELRKSGECNSWIEFLTDFHWPNENQCVAARAAIAKAQSEPLP